MPFYNPVTGDYDGAIPFGPGADWVPGTHKPVGQGGNFIPVHLPDTGGYPLPGGKGGGKSVPPPNIINGLGALPGISGPDAPAKVYGECVVEGRVIAHVLETWYRRAFVCVCAGPIDSLSPDQFHGTFPNNVSGTPENDDTLAWWDIHLGGGVPAYLEWYPVPSGSPWANYVLISVAIPQWVFNDYGSRSGWLTDLPPVWRYKVKGTKVYDPRHPAAAIAWSNNPALCVRDFLVDSVDGCGVSAALLDDASWAAAADACDVSVELTTGVYGPRYTMDIAIVAEGTADDWLKKLLMHFNARLVVTEAGLLGVTVDAATSATPTVLDATNSREWKIWQPDRKDLPSRVTIEFPDPANDYAIDSVSEDTAELTAGTDVLREQVYRLEGLRGKPRARWMAKYLLRAQTWASGRASGIISPGLANLPVGSRVNLTAAGAVSAPFRIAKKELIPETREVTVELWEYDAAVYSTSATAADTPFAPPAAPAALVGAALTTDHTETVETAGDGYTQKTVNHYWTISYDLPAGHLSSIVYRYGTGEYMDPALTSDADVLWARLDPATQGELPLAGNLPASGGHDVLYIPGVVKTSDTSTKYLDPARSAAASGGGTYFSCIAVRIRDQWGQLSPGVMFYQGLTVPGGFGGTTNSITDGHLVAYRASDGTLIDGGAIPAPAAAAPTGSVVMWMTASAPTGWLILDGAAVSRSTYSALFALFGTTYGAGNGSTTFNLPDMRQRFPLGKAASGTGSTLGGTGGTIDHVHSVDPPSTTTPDGSWGAIAFHPGVNAGYTVNSGVQHTHTVDIAAFNSAAANPPFLAVHFIVKT